MVAIQLANPVAKDLVNALDEFYERYWSYFDGFGDADSPCRHDRRYIENILIPNLVDQLENDNFATTNPSVQKTAVKMAKDAMRMLRRYRPY